MQKKILIILLSFSFLSYGNSIEHKIKNLFNWRQVVIWGHKLHTHTHSYIHNGFFRALSYLGVPVLWLDNNDDISQVDFSNSLFITEGQVSDSIPIIMDSFYILHNCCSDRFLPIRKKGNYITLQVFTRDVYKLSGLIKHESHVYSLKSGRCLFMPWATDLLPYEIDEVKKSLGLKKLKKDAWWIGTIGGGVFGNAEQLGPFKRACKECGVSFKNTMLNASIEDNCNIIKNSYMAPAIVGKWQREQGYIPCRIFKNISYGAFGATNSEEVQNLFEGRLVYNSDTYQLFYDLKNKIENMDIAELYEQMDFVRDNHTYLNRIYRLLEFIALIKNSDV